MESLETISSIVYHKVSKKIGSKEKVTIRRDVIDINENIFNYINRKHHVTMISGSYREGFFMAGSDRDYMFWFVRDHVICRLSQLSHYENNSRSIIFMEDRYTRPGFVLLELLSQNGNIFTLKSCIQLQGTLYISSFLYRDFMHLASLPFPNLVLHGPCTSASIKNLEFDFAPCFACDRWPPQAYSWIDRCRIQHWPQPTVLRSIIKNGCHLVPVGAKNSPLELVEWRLSFSQAEQKLVYSMTECQFLTYGLMKLFLKEVLNLGLPESDKLLCSYFMKTAVFWNIQGEKTLVWSSEKFLLCFWRCYKFLMKCVLTGYCPNFFVPENNMFFPKVMGRKQTSLFARMHALYNEGMTCLLRCASIHDQLYVAISDPNITITNNFSEIEKDFELYHCLNRLLLPSTTMMQRALNDYQNTLNFLFEKCKSNISSIQRLLIYQFTIWFCQQHLLFKQGHPIHGKNNTESYRHKTKDVRLMEVASKSGNVSSVAYLALYHYNDGRYTQALSLLHEFKSKLYKPFVFFNDHWIKNKYTQAMSGKSLYTKVSQALVSHILIPSDIYFPEIRLEQRVTEKLGGPCLFISPFVFLYFLTFLCHYRLRSPQLENALYGLHTLVQNVLRNRKYDWYINKYHGRDTACQIVGICHQLSGQPQQALASYMESLYQLPVSMIWVATLYRLQTLCFHFEH